MKKRFLSLILSMVLCLGLFAPAMGAEKTFSDMPKTHWAYQAVGAMVDKEMRELMDTAHMSRDNAAVLAAVNLADQLCKAQDGSENLRRQLKTYLDEASQAKSEAAELRRKLQNQQNQNVLKTIPTT